MLVFSKSIDRDGKWHLENRCRERCGKPISWLLEIIAEINSYLPPDWRMTREKNGFRIQFKADVEGSLVGYSYRLDSGEFLHIVDTVFLKGFTDTPTRVIGADGKKRLKPMKQAYKKEQPESIVPNLYFFRPAPENFATPLFARQYEKVKQSKDRGMAGDQYHRVHPLTRDGLDPARFIWLRWTTNGDLLIKAASESYHGKDFWKIPRLSDRRQERASVEVYLKNYLEMVENFAIKPQPYEFGERAFGVEYKFHLPDLIQPDADIIFRDFEKYLLKSDFKKFARRPGGKKVVDTYLDDSAFSLHNANLSLRIREKDETFYLSLKKRITGTGQTENNLSYRRMEEEAFLKKSQYEKLLQGESVPLLPLRLLDFLVPEHDVLKPVLEVDNQRRSLLLQDQDSRRLELGFDKVSYSFGSKLFGPFFEIELESHGVPESDMRILAEWLAESQMVLPSTQTKYGRGVSLYRMRQLIPRPRQVKPVIIDTDCGVDDALALVLALQSPELEVLAVTTLSGNVHIDHVIPNVFKVFAALGLENPPPVARGAEVPLSGIEVTADSVHGFDGLGDCVEDEILTASDPRPAWRLICDLAREKPQEITLITIGPLTNLALAIKNDPEAVSMLKEVVSMGGVFAAEGNISPGAEFNVRADPQAAHNVVEFCTRLNRKIPLDKEGRELKLPEQPAVADFAAVAEFKERPANDPQTLPLTFVGLDVTHQVVLRRPLLKSLVAARPQNRLLAFLKDISAKYMEFYFENQGLDGCFLHDPLAVAYVINPAFLSVKKHIVKIETSGRFTSGVSFTDNRPTRNRLWRNPADEVIGVAERVEKEAFEEFLLTRICGK